MTTLTDTAPANLARRRWYGNLTVQVVLAILLGIATGHLAPAFGQAMQPLGDLFIRLIKMVVAPIAFLTIVSGIAAIGDLRRVGRIGGMALLYFELVTTLALGIGVVVMNLLRPGDGFDRAAFGAGAVDVTKYSQMAGEHYMLDFLTHLVPDNIVAAFAKGDLLQIVLFGILFGCAAALAGDRVKPALDAMHALADILFKIIALIMRLAPIGAYGAMAFAVSKYGLGSVLVLGKLMMAVYVTCALFVFVVLNAIARMCGFSLLRFLRFVGQEIMIVFGTASSESVLPRLMARLERLGCSSPTVGLVLPTGYSFNMDGTSIYLSMAALFIAQAYGIDLSLGQQIGLLVLLMVTSKGAGAVAGAGFVTLAATLSATHALPVEGLALLIGVDRFMAEARSVTNIVGNSLATVVVAKMCGEFDETAADAAYREHFGDDARFHRNR